MPNLDPADLSKAQWDYLVTLLNNEKATRLSGIQYIGKAYQLWSEVVPSIGVQLKKFTENEYATTRHKVVTTFDIILAVKSTDASAVERFGANTPANLEDAMAILQPYVSDGSGNGLSPVLRDPQYRTLNGNAVRSQISDISYEWEIGPGEAPQIWAYALVTFMAEQIVAIT